MMPQLSEYQFPPGTPVELADFYHELRELWNGGRFIFTIATADPTYTGEEGEVVLTNAATYKISAYINGGWRRATLS